MILPRASMLEDMSRENTAPSLPSGPATAMAFVPRNGSAAPWGAMLAGPLEATSATSPRRAARRA
jgi:hypothetical protein